MEGLFVALISSIILSVMGLAGFTCSLGFKIIDAINELTNAVKEKTQSKDCVEEENNRFIDSDKAEK